MRVLHPIHLCALALALTGSVARADVDIRREGRPWARLEDDGTVRIDGAAAGKLESDGTVRREGRYVGRVELAGDIRIEGGGHVGEIENDGTLRRGGSYLASIESNGTIRRNGTVWGSASNCCGDFGSKRAVTAVLVFFAADFF